MAVQTESHWVTDKTCLLVFFWGGLAKPFKSRMPYWVPEEFLADYINLALSLSGTAFRVELAAEPVLFCEPTESAPEPTPFRDPTESAPFPGVHTFEMNCTLRVNCAQALIRLASVSTY